MAKNRSIDRELLEQICRKKEWVSNYQVRLALATNPKTPLGTAVRFVLDLAAARDLRDAGEEQERAVGDLRYGQAVGDRARWLRQS